MDQSEREQEGYPRVGSRQRKSTTRVKMAQSPYLSKMGSQGPYGELNRPALSLTGKLRREKLHGKLQSTLSNF